MDIRRLDDMAAVAPQLLPDEIAAVKAAGYALIVNNRPDGEEAGQPSSDEMERAATGAGLEYAHIPLGREGLTPGHIEAVRGALVGATGPVLMFCRSGTRSATLWGFAEAGRGRGPEEIVALARAAGYDLSGYLPAMRALAR